jgi:hypothetical protein
MVMGMALWKRAELALMWRSQLELLVSQDLCKVRAAQKQSKWIFRLVNYLVI